MVLHIDPGKAPEVLSARFSVAEKNRTSEQEHIVAFGDLERTTHDRRALIDRAHDRRVRSCQAGFKPCQAFGARCRAIGVSNLAVADQIDAAQRVKGPAEVVGVIPEGRVIDVGIGRDQGRQSLNDRDLLREIARQAVRGRLDFLGCGAALFIQGLAGLIALDVKGRGADEKKSDHCAEP